MSIAASLLTLVLAQTAGDPAPPRAAPAVVILSDTGTTRDGLPVAVLHPDPGAYGEVLGRGYARRLVRLYEMAQRFARPGVQPQPAYLLLTDNQGGFPRRGFFLDTARPDLAYVDLHRRSTPSGRAGAVDQIYPHELLHVIVGDLAGPTPEGRATQVHAVGVRTDRITAFNEGFAEHAQLMAIDDAGAMPGTRAIASDMAARGRALDQMRAYGAAVAARWSIAPKARMTFPLWFSRAEQILRYHGVRENLFARAPALPERLLTRGNAYRAYLIDNVLPGQADGAPRTAAQLLATEGVVSGLFHRLVMHPQVQASYAAPGFYAKFGTTKDAIDGLDNAYLKLFAAIRAGGYDALAVVRAQQAAFPQDAAAIESVLRDVLLHQPTPRAPELWLLNADFTAGTTLFDQFRGAPIVQAFDLNAGSLADFVAIPGIDRTLAAEIARGVPYDSVDALRRVPGLTPEVFARFEQMRAAILQPPPAGTELEGDLSFRTILMPYAWRALWVWLACGTVSAFLYRRVRRASWRRAALNGFAASLVALLAGWTAERGGAALAFAAPVVIFGLPAALYTLWRARSRRQAARTLLAWACAAAAAVLAVTPIG